MVSIRILRDPTATLRNPSQLMRLTGWWPLILAPTAIIAFEPETWLRWQLMWVLSVTIFAGCKWLTWRRAAVREWVSPTRNAAYLLAWPGLDAETFLRMETRRNMTSPSGREWCLAVLRLSLGLSLLAIAQSLISLWPPYWVGWIGMVGIVFTLHFGIFHLLSCVYRTVGIRAIPIMNFPLRACSVSEFWGRRWNLAFRDIAHRFVFRPLSSQLGPVAALVAGFLVSGVLHELVITLPAEGGYGGPTLYFLIQAIAILLERTRSIRRVILQGKLPGWLFTVCVTLMPVGLLFPEEFVVGIVVPFLAELRVLL